MMYLTHFKMVQEGNEYFYIVLLLFVQLFKV